MNTTGSSLSSSSSRISARRLAELIRSVLEGAAVRTLCVPSSASGHSLMVLVSPVRDADIHRSDIRAARETAALVMLCDPDRPAQVPATWMMDGYGLTLAEANVALIISSGATIPQTATRLRVSPNTVKTHLRRVYGKTCTSRQAELSRLVAMIDLPRNPALPQ